MSIGSKYYYNVVLPSNGITSGIILNEVQTIDANYSLVVGNNNYLGVVENNISTDNGTYVNSMNKEINAIKIVKEKSEAFIQYSKLAPKLVKETVQSANIEVPEVHKELFFSEAPRYKASEDYKISQEGFKLRQDFLSHFSDFEVGMATGLKKGTEIASYAVGGYGAVKGIAKSKFLHV